MHLDHLLGQPGEDDLSAGGPAATGAALLQQLLLRDAAGQGNQTQAGGGRGRVGVASSVPLQLMALSFLLLSVLICICMPFGRMFYYILQGRSDLVEEEISGWRLTVLSVSSEAEGPRRRRQAGTEVGAAGAEATGRRKGPVAGACCGSSDTGGAEGGGEQEAAADGDEDGGEHVRATSTADSQPGERILRWLPADEASATFARQLSSSEDTEVVAAPWSTEAVKRILLEKGTPVDQWSQEAVESLSQELSSGQARLRFRGKPNRCVDLLLLMIEYPAERRVLQEFEAKHVKYSPLPEKTVATRMRFDEDLFVAARRTLQKANVPEESVWIHDSLIDVTDTVENMDFFPGLPSVVRKFLMRVEVTTTSDQALLDLGLPSGTLTAASSRKYRWVPRDSAIGLLKHCNLGANQPRASRLRPSWMSRSMNRTIVDPEVQGLLPWTVEAVAEICAKYHVTDYKKEFGVGLEDLVRELGNGSSHLAVRRHGGRLLCTRDVVSLLLESPGGLTAVVAEEHRREGMKPLNTQELPNALRFADEGLAAAARRAAKVELGLSAAELTIAAEAIKEVCVTENMLNTQELFPWPVGERQPPGRRLRHFVVRGEVPKGSPTLARLAPTRE